MIDRTTAPALKIPGSMHIQKAVQHPLENGRELYIINSGNDEVIKFELIFPTSGSTRMDFILQTAVNQLLDAGTKRKSALEVAESFDYYGSHFQADTGPDWKSLSLFSLSRFFGQSLSILEEILNEADFPEREIETWKTRSIQSLHVNREKVAWISRTEFMSSLFGENHPYGFTANEQDYATANRESMKSFFTHAYPGNTCIAVVSGKIDEKATADAAGFMNRMKSVSPWNKLNHSESNQHPAGKKYLEKKDALQTGIRIGKLLFDKKHPDYPVMQVVNTIFGGYFGSRLMSNIREDKGFTYGIGSGIHPYKSTGVFSISTEVGKDVSDAALTEIYFELSRLAKEPVAEEELELVKNYMIGSFQRSIDGPFALADRFKGLRLWNLDYNYLERYLEIVKNCRPETVMELTIKHLNPDSMTQITAG